VETIEETRGNLRLAEDKAGFLEDKLDVYWKIIRLLVGMHQRESGKRYDEDAFRFVERARARASLDMMSEAEKRVDAGIDPSLMDRQRQIQRHIALLQAQLADENSKPRTEPGRIASLTSAIGAADEEYRDFRRDMRSRNPRYAAFRYPEPISLTGARQLLSDRALLLEYAVGENESFLFAVTRTDQLIARLPGAATLRPMIRRMREAVIAPPARSTLAAYWLDAQALYRCLIAPAGRLLAGSDEIVVVADGMLNYLPFDSLIEPSREITADLDPARMPFLIRRYAISYAPSMSVLATVRRQRDLRPEPSRMFVAWGDPAYNIVPNTGQTDGARSSGPRLSFTALPRLQYSRREVETIARMYPPASVETFLGDRAREDRAKSPEIAGFRFVHFAVHGLINESRPQLSGLFLSRPSKAEREQGQDGLLQVHEIFDLRLNADLVVLSACETGLGKAVKGEGLTGFTQAFLYAGASSVAVSLWKVEDRSTADLMIRFYRHMRDGGLARAQALRRAQLDLIGNRDTAQPHYWAAFSLIGDSGPALQ
jgi:CHAT domain-containing protein